MAKQSGSQPAAGFRAEPYAWNCVQSNRKILCEIEVYCTRARARGHLSAREVLLFTRNRLYFIRSVHMASITEFKVLNYVLIAGSTVSSTSAGLAASLSSGGKNNRSTENGRVAPPLPYAPPWVVFWHLSPLSAGCEPAHNGERCQKTDVGDCNQLF